MNKNFHFCAIIVIEKSHKFIKLIIYTYGTIFIGMNIQCFPISLLPL